MNVGGALWGIKRGTFGACFRGLWPRFYWLCFWLLSVAGHPGHKKVSLYTHTHTQRALSPALFPFPSLLYFFLKNLKNNAPDAPVYKKWLFYGKKGGA